MIGLGLFYILISHVPTGFFDGNPALDLPPNAAHCHG